MALHDPPVEVPFIDTFIEVEGKKIPIKAYVTRAWAEWMIIAKRDKADKLSGGTANNIATIDSDGNIADSGKTLPTGDIVGSSDTQTLTNKTLTTPTVSSGTFTTPTLLVPVVADLSSMTHDHTSAAGGGDYPWADMTQSATQSDAVAVSAISLGAGADTVDRATFNTDLGTLVTEINAIKNVINALIDKLQAAVLMT